MTSIFCVHRLVCFPQLERMTKVAMERDGIHASEKEHVHAAMSRIRMVRCSILQQAHSTAPS
jgi:hypothetical protein